jgi:predicted RNase H-related nuclease YkuK (DUF458 family)
MHKRINVNEVATFIRQQTPETKVFIGCDSERVKQNGVWFADYIVAVVVHIDGKHGCKVFGEVVRERDYDQKKNRPRMRLMTEVYKASEMYLTLSPLIADREIEVHLDINPIEIHGSSCVINEAIGYIRGTCNVTPMVKPQAWCASYVADRYKTLKA